MFACVCVCVGGGGRWGGELSSAEHEIFSPNKYENVDNSFHIQLCLARKNLQLLVI